MREKQINHTGFRQLMIAILVTGCLLILSAKAEAQQTLTVIANQKGAPATLSYPELRSVFLGERQRWSNGTKVVIAMLKTSNTLGETICRKVYEMKPDELNKYWLALVFQGKVSAPNFFNTVSELQSFVSQNPGAIGIIDENVTIAELKTVLIDGKKSL
jgi:ABC-type phosphate transport system substrate-binding protein